MKNVFSLYFTLVLLVVSIHVNSDVNQTCQKPLNLVEACNNAIDHVPFIALDHCTATLTSNKKIKSATDLHGLALDHAIKAESKIEELMNLEGSPELKKSFHACFEVYSDAADQLRDALDNMKGMLYGAAGELLKKASDAPKMCARAFDEMNGLVPPMSNADKEFGKIAALALGIAAFGVGFCLENGGIILFRLICALN